MWTWAPAGASQFSPRDTRRTTTARAPARAKPRDAPTSRWRASISGSKKLINAAAGEAQQVIVVVAFVQPSNTDLRDSKWPRARIPACSNCISTR